MKKYDYYRPSAASLGRKKKTRKKHSFSFLKSFILFLIFVGFCVACYVSISAAYKAFSASRLGGWMPKAAAVSGVEGVLAKELLEAAQAKVGAPFAVQDAVELQRQLAAKYPQLRRITVKRGLLSGKLKVEAVRRRPVAKFELSGGRLQFIDKDSTVYTDPNPDPLLSVPFVELEGNTPQQLGNEFIELLHSTLKLKDQLDFATLRFNTNTDTVRMYLPDGSVLDFGPAKNLRAKARRAAQIERYVSQAGLSRPHTLDFTYFEDGKVFLRQTAH